MPSRQSALSRGRAASFKSRSTTANRSAISSRLGSWATIQRLASQSAKDTIVTCHKELRSRENALKERDIALHFVAKFLHRVHDGVDLPAEPCFGSPECGNSLLQRDVPNDEEINIAPGCLLATRDRAVDEGEFDTTLADECRKTGTKD